MSARVPLPSYHHAFLTRVALSSVMFKKHMGSGTTLPGFESYLYHL